MHDGIIKDLKEHVARTSPPVEVITFSEYIEKVRGNPRIAALAHKRVYDMIKSYGMEVDQDTGAERYLFFETQLFGIEDSTKQIMEYFKGAAMGSDVARRLLLLYGPPSSGKSNLSSMIKDCMEEWTRKPDGALYGIDGCPMNEEPLHLIPNLMRRKIAEELGVTIEGDLCPVCAAKLAENGNDFMKFKARRIFFSQQGRCGIGTFVPSDPKTADMAELVGSVDLSKIGKYGTESDARAYRFDGELNISNRGLAEFIEILKNDVKFLYVLLTLTQEKNIKTPRFPLIYCDEIILAHTNEAEYKNFVGKPENEALIDRMIVCRVKYNLKVNDEIKIYEKLLRTGDTKDIHIAPHALRVAAMFAVLSRLEEPKDKSLDKIKKMKLYNGDDVEGVSKGDIPRLKKESISEGMDGISPRYVVNRLITTAIRCSEIGEQKYITPIDVMIALKDGLETTSKLKPEEGSRYEELLSQVRAEFDHIARNEVQKAFFVSFAAEAQALMDNYVDNVEAYLEQTKIKDPITQEDIDPDEKLMRSIESKIGIGDDAKDSFRNEVLRKVGAATRRGDEFHYESHGRLREAIEKQMFEERRDTIKLTITSRTKDPKELERINQVVGTLCEKHGYIAESANELLKYVSSLMAREK